MSPAGPLWQAIWPLRVPLVRCDRPAWAQPVLADGLIWQGPGHALLLEGEPPSPERILAFFSSPLWVTLPTPAPPGTLVTPAPVRIQPLGNPVDFYHALGAMSGALPVCPDWGRQDWSAALMAWLASEEDCP